MHYSDSRTKDILRLGVHRQSYIGTTVSKSMFVLEGREVCMDAWQKIYGISKSNFYKYKGYARSGRRTQYHQNKGRKKVSMRKEQAIQTMKMLLVSKANSIPHKTRSLKTGEKVVQKILPNGTKWNGILETINEVILSTNFPVLFHVRLFIQHGRRIQFTRHYTL
jgi:hypothetical protein